MKKYIEMGTCYSNGELRVQTVCRATNPVDKTSHIVYTKVLDGGYASDAYFMPEEEFKKTFRV